MRAVLEDAVRQIASELEGMDVDTAQKHPHGCAHLWDAQEIIEHLVLSYRNSARDLERRLAKGRVGRKQKRTFPQWVLQLMILSFGHIPRGAPAMEDTVPVAGSILPKDGEQLASLLRKELDAMDEVLDSCRRRFGMARVAVHPILGPLRVDQWRRFHVVHSLHHLKQVQRVRLEVAPNLFQDRAHKLALTKELQVPAQSSFT